MAKKILLPALALILIIVMIGLTFQLRREVGWWAFIDCFTLFMMAFSWMMSYVIGRMVPHAGKVLQKTAIVFAVLTVIAWLVLYFML